MPLSFNLIASRRRCVCFWHINNQSLWSGIFVVQIYRGSLQIWFKIEQQSISVLWNLTVQHCKLQLSEYSQHQLVKNCYHQLKYRKRPCLLRINVCIGQFPFTCCWQMAMFTWDRLRSAQSTGQSRQQTVLLRVPVAHSLSTSTIYKRSPALKIYQMSSDSIPAHWSSKSRFKFLYACAKELEDCKMNLTRFTRGAAITGVGKNHSEFSWIHGN